MTARNLTIKTFEASAAMFHMVDICSISSSSSVLVCCDKGVVC